MKIQYKKELNRTSVLLYKLSFVEFPDYKILHLSSHAFAKPFPILQHFNKEAYQ